MGCGVAGVAVAINWESKHPPATVCGRWVVRGRGGACGVMGVVRGSALR